MLRRSFVRGFAAVLVLAALGAGGWFALRDSSLARVTKVDVTGATTSEEGPIRAALEDAGREMTTLHVREDVLHDAVAAYPSVAGLRVETDFPHELSVQVLEHRPVAALEVDGRRTPVSTEGVVLTGVQADPDLPLIRHQQVPGQHIDDARTLAALTIAGAAPRELLRRSERLHWGPEGLTVDLRNGPPLYFGTRDDAAAKWAAAARVLAEPTAAGATYLDLRVPGRVAAGGVGPVPQAEPTPVPQP